MIKYDMWLTYDLLFAISIDLMYDIWYETIQYELIWYDMTTCLTFWYVYSIWLEHVWNGHLCAFQNIAIRCDSETRWSGHPKLPFWCRRIVYTWEACLCVCACLNMSTYWHMHRKCVVCMYNIYIYILKMYIYIHMYTTSVWICMNLYEYTCKIRVLHMVTCFRCPLTQPRCEDCFCRERKDLENHPYQHYHQQGGVQQSISVER